MADAENTNNVEVDQEDLNKGMMEYQKLDEVAEKRSAKLSEELIKQIIDTKDPDKFNMTLAILTISKTLTHLASYFYEDENSFLEDIKKARQSIPADIVPALLDPQPCGKCEKCINGLPDECIAPIIRTDMTTSKIIPIISSMLIEYDLFNKILWMNTVGKETVERKAAEAAAQEQRDNSDIPSVPSD